MSRVATIDYVGTAQKGPPSGKRRCQLCSVMDLQERAVQYQKLLAVGKELLAEPDLDRMLRLALDHLIKITGAEKGMVLVFDKRGDTLFESARNRHKEDIQHYEFDFSREIITEVKAKKSPVCFPVGFENLAARTGRGLYHHKLPSLICVPLRKQSEIFGVIYLDNRAVQDVFTPQTCAFAQNFADFISRAAHDVFDRSRAYNRVQLLESELRANYSFDAIIGHHPKMIEVLDLVARVADTDATVLLQGESGTGKELVVKAIHYNSSRRNKPFLAINCGALPESLLESELFGHEKGAFTGAVQKMVGKFEAADGGTIFLDEVDSMSLSLQVKLLRVLQSGEYSPVGSSTPEFCDVRIVAATNQNLRKLVAEGKFRDDLFYRLNIVPIFLPPLRERKEDIPLLVNHFLRQFGERGQKLQISKAAQKLLQSYDYPGNVRELENAIRRTVILSKSQKINMEHLPEEMRRCYYSTEKTLCFDLPFHQAKADLVETFEKDYLVRILAKHKGIISQAAKEAGLNRKNFRAKMDKWDIHSGDFR